MRHALIVVLAVSILSGLVFAQTSVSQPSYSFKDNALGMSLAEFKATNNQGTVYINAGKPDLREQADPKLAQTVRTPLCTDTYQGLEWPTEQGDGEVLCNASPGSVNPQARQIADVTAMDVIYHFYSQKLAAITIQFSTVSYPRIREAFIAEYGKPTQLFKRGDLNGNGVRWSGEVVTWNRDKQVIILEEGSGDGPQDPTSNAIIADILLIPVRF